jgi:hypothetical protein
MIEFIEIYGGDPSLATPEGQWRNMRSAAEMWRHREAMITRGYVPLFLDFETPIDSHWAERLGVKL